MYTQYSTIILLAKKEIDNNISITITAICHYNVPSMNTYISNITC